MKRRILYGVTILITMAALMPTVLGCRQREPLLCIEKELYSNTDSQDVLFSSNAPYYVGEKYYWWIKIAITAKKDLNRVVVFDRLGAEFMIEGICLCWPKQPDLPSYPSPDPKPFDYTFDYNAGNPWPERNEVVEIKDRCGCVVTQGCVSRCGVRFKGRFCSGDEDVFSVRWTGKSCKAHFEWIIGAMAEDETKIIFLVISTDINPGGKQEFTSPCSHYLNSGATAKVYKLKQWRCWRRVRFFTWCRCWKRWVPVYSTTTGPITIEVQQN